MKLNFVWLLGHMVKMDVVDFSVVVFFFLSGLFYLAFSANLGLSANDDNCDRYNCCLHEICNVLTFAA